MDLYACKPSTFCSLCQNINCKVTVKDQQVPFKPQSNPLKNAKRYSQKADRLKQNVLKIIQMTPKKAREGNKGKQKLQTQNKE